MAFFTKVGTSAGNDQLWVSSHLSCYWAYSWPCSLWMQRTHASSNARPRNQWQPKGVHSQLIAEWPNLEICSMLVLVQVWLIKKDEGVQAYLKHEVVMPGLPKTCAMLESLLPWSKGFGLMQHGQGHERLGSTPPTPKPALLFWG